MKNTYVISDLHGQKDLFEKLLLKIEYTEEDKIYFLGDLIDRGPESIELLEMVMSMKNATCLLGNHELMMRQSLSFSQTRCEGDWAIPCNGGKKTFDKFMLLDSEEKTEISNWLFTLPDSIDLEVNGQKYVLTHGNPMGANYFEKVWDRPELRSYSNVLDKDTIYIVGHTPTLIFDYEQNEYNGTPLPSEASIKKNADGNLWFIDTGAAMVEFYKESIKKNHKATSQLIRPGICAVRLEDQKIFYEYTGVCD